jgi:2'-5' RNA ligase
MAFYFPVHITLRGRFLAKKSILLKIVNEIKQIDIKIPIDIQLSEPMYIDPELVWLEVLPYYKGYRTLLFLHQLFEELVRESVIKDEVPDVYKGNEFRPHLTLGWGVKYEAWEELLYTGLTPVQESKIDSIVLVRYSRRSPPSYPPRKENTLIKESLILCGSENS